MNTRDAQVLRSNRLSIEEKNARRRERAQRKVEKAIDAMIDIQDLGLGNDTVQRVLDLLNGLNF